MTVICTDGKTIACDSQETGDYIEKCQKLYKLRDGRIAGTIGASGLGLKLIRYLNGEITAEEWFQTTAGEDYAALLLVGRRKEVNWDRKGKVSTEFGCWLLESMALEEIPCQMPAAVGSGGLLAMGAMEAGLTPKDAVKIAIKRDPYCGGKIEVWDVPK